MKLSRALKLKKKLAGEIANLQKLIRDENLQLDENRSRFDIVELMEELETKQNKLIEVKAKIAVANANIWQSIFTITELKGTISFLRSLNTQEGTFNESGGYGSGTIVKKYIPQFTKADVEKTVTRLEQDIENLQEQIDEYNQTNTIE